MDIQKLIEETKHNLLDDVLRKAFSPTTEPLEVSSGLEQALVALVNLTDKRAQQKNILCKKRCKAKLRDKQWWADCLQTVPYQQSHNVKFPDCRATGIIRAKLRNNLPSHLLSSSKLPVTDWLYTCNSSCVNKSALLGSEIRLYGSITKLCELLKEESHPAWLHLRKLGCYVKQQKQVVKYLNKIKSFTVNVELVPNYIKQITLPVPINDYVTLTPVTSQSMQAHIHRALEQKYGIRATYHCDRASNIGYFASKSGGWLRQFKTLPRIPNTFKRYAPLNQWLNRTRFESMELYLAADHLLLTVNHRTQLLQQARAQITSMLFDWESKVDNSGTLDHRELAQCFNYCLSITKRARKFAYIPKLTQLFEEIFSHEVSTNGLNSSSDKLTYSVSYLTIPNIDITHATAENSGYSIGLPSLMGIFGYIHAFERRVRSEIKGFTIKRFAMRVERYHLEHRGISLEATRVKEYHVEPSAQRDSWQCDLTLGLLLECEGTDELTLSEVPRWLPKRLCRGHAHIPHARQHSITLSLDLQSCVEQLQNRLGLWLTAINNCEINSINSLINQLEKNTMISCLGYHLINDPIKNKGSMYGYPHAFCEPVLGLVKGEQAIRPYQLSRLFWCYQWTVSGPLLIINEENNETAK